MGVGDLGQTEVVLSGETLVHHHRRPALFLFPVTGHSRRFDRKAFHTLTVPPPTCLSVQAQLIDFEVGSLPVT